MDDVKVEETAQNKEIVCVGCEGPTSPYIKLISSDNHEFVLKRDYVMLSGTIKAMLSGPGEFAENQSNEVHLKNIESHILQKVCSFLTFKANNIYNPTAPNFDIESEIALDLIMAASFLDC